MATPVNDSYSTASGGIIYGGRSNLPDWLPASGTMGRVSLNYMSDVFDVNNPDSLLIDDDGTFILDAWCGTTYCSGWGSMGGIAAFGGGHNDRVNNAVFMYDIGTRLWSRISNGTPIPIRARDFDLVAGNKDGVPSAFLNDWCEYWTSTARDAVITGKCAPPHTYGNFKYVPGAQAGNTRGFLVLMGGFALGAHRLDLDNPSNGWDRCGPLFTTVYPTTRRVAYGCTLWDSSRSRLYAFPSHGGSQDGSVIVNFPNQTVSTSTQNFVDSYECLGRYAAADDKYLVFKGQNYGQYPVLFVCHPVTGAKVSPPQSGPLPPRFYTMEWDEDQRRLVGWDGTTSTLWFGQAPALMTTGTWVWTSQNFTNAETVLSQNGPNSMFDRLHLHEDLQAFFVVTRVGGPVQCWKI